MMAFTSSELTILNILLQKTPDAVGSSMARIKTGMLKTTVERVKQVSAAFFFLSVALKMHSQMQLPDKDNGNW